MPKTPRFTAKTLAQKHELFAGVYKQFTLPLTKFLVKRMGGDQKAAEEVFSRTIVAAWKGWSTFENKSSYFTWLCRIGLNKIADYYREQVNERSRFVSPTLSSWANVKDENLLPEEKLVLQELQGTVKECLDLLPEEKRKLLYLRFWQQLTMQKIAQILGVSVRAAEGKVYRAKLAFREIYLNNNCRG